jgi:hypothetical protein
MSTAFSFNGELDGIISDIKSGRNDIAGLRALIDGQSR